MIEVTEVLEEDLAFQKKRLEDLTAWKCDEALIEEQSAIISELEKKIESMQGTA